MVRRMMMVIVVVMVSGLFTGSVEAQSEDCPTVVDNVGQSETQVAAGAYSDALHAYACVLEADPLNAVARIGRLQTALLGGDYLTAYGDAFLLNDGSFRVLDTAIATQTEILAAHPDNVDAYQVRAFLYLFSGQPGIARADASRILKLEPSNSFAYLIQAASNDMMGDAVSATRAFETAVELAPDDAQLYGLMAASQWGSFNIDGMAANSNRALFLDPGLAHAYRLHGMTQLVTGNPEGVFADANQAIERDPAYYAFYILRAHAHMALGKRQAAFTDLVTAIDLNPRTINGHALRAQVALALGQVDAARQDFATAIALRTRETVEGVGLTAGEPVIVTMTAGRTYYLPFQGRAGQIATVRAISVNPGEVDPLVQVVSPGGKPLGFNDDASDETLDAVVTDIEIREDGTYMLVLSHASGGSEGNIALSLALHWRCCPPSR